MTALKDIISYSKENSIKYIENEPMKNHTTFKIGGPARLMIFPRESFQLSEIISRCNQNNVKFFIVGNGSNLLVSDSGINGIVIMTENFRGIRLIGENEIEVYCGELLSKTAVFAQKNGLTGLEFAQGIPGSVGGGVYMNAGAYDGEMSNVVYKTEFCDTSGVISSVTGNEHCFGYRSSIFKDKGLAVIKTHLKLNIGDPEKIKQKMQEFGKMRTDKQPLEYPSAGSVFKRPEGYFTGKLIQDCGLKGFTIGGAQISEKHTGFIINKGNATCSDVLELIETIKKTVLQKYGIELQTEIKYID